MSRRSAILALLAAAFLTLSPAAALAAAPRASLTDIEQDVMCPSCREPLIAAQSPQADAERNYIRTLIAHGLTKSQIERNLVAQYGSAVLGKPPASGFDLTVYLIPAAIIALGLGVLAVVLPRWRRAAKARSRTPRGAAPALSASDAARLDEDLARYGN
jgi:cytochrome c-type biogenesis protein CcmH